MSLPNSEIMYVLLDIITKESPNLLRNVAKQDVLVIYLH